ncbi:MAG: VOC family protein [Bacteroidota bacterium]
MASLQKITPCLWFAGEAKEAAEYYTQIFKNSSIGRTSYYTEEGKEEHQMPPGSVLTIEFELDGQRFTALNGGPIFKFTEAVSFMVGCDTQEEIDYYWDKLTPGGDPKAQQCGWLKDKFGLSWQVYPSIMDEMMSDPDTTKVARVMKAFMPMKKLDIAKIKAAYNGE